MSDDGDNGWNVFPSDCLKFHLPYKKLCRKCLLLSEKLRLDSEAQNKLYESHFHKTLEATLKMYQGYDAWEEFKKAADMLAEMHRMARRRLNMVFASAFSSGAANFSRDFIMQFKCLYADKKLVTSQKSFPTGTLDHILCSSSDPPLGAFKRRRRILKARRRRTGPILPQPVVAFCSSSEDDAPSTAETEKYRQLSQPDHCSALPSISKRQKLDSAILSSPSNSIRSTTTRSHSPSTCSVCSDECSSEDGFQCSCSDIGDHDPVLKD